MLNASLISAIAVASSLSLTSLNVAAAPASNAANNALFKSAQNASLNRGQPRNGLPGKGRAVAIDREVFGKGRMLLNLGVGPDLTAVRERQTKQDNGHRETWIGRIDGDPDSNVTLARVGNAVAGTVRHQGRLFKLTPTANGTQRIDEVDPSDPLPSSEMVPDLVGGETGTTATTTSTSTGGVDVVDVLVAYTPEAKNAYGGIDGVEALIELAVAETNQAYQNSQAPMTLRLVSAMETSYHETGDMNLDLNRLTAPGDGYLEDVTAMRDQVGADLVSLIVSTGSYCGLSWQMGVLNSAYAAYAFNIVDGDCATGYYSFGHEIGHNLGLAHDHANATYSALPHAYGYQDPNANFRTIMAYACTESCERVPHFSNPEISYNGLTTGVDGWADNALALTETAPLVATWRASVVPYPPMAPNDLTALALSFDRIDLAWTDDATDEDGYRVERSADGENFSLIATLDADTETFTDQPLSAETTYYYRVSAFNGAGVSAASNDAWATTEAAPIAIPTAPSALSANALSHTEIAISWIDNASDEVGFELERSLDSGANWNLLASLGANVSAYTDQGLAASTSYSYRVRATGAGDASDYSNSASATTDAEPVYPPTAPSTLDALALSETEIALRWSDNASDETSMELERSTDGGMNWTLIANLAANVTAYTDSGLAADSYYLYRVRALGEGGPSDYSNASGATTLAPTPIIECSVQGASSLSLGDRDMTWQLTNTAGNDVTISRVRISWPSSQGDLKKISLNGRQLWTGSDAPTSADLSAGWTDPSALTLSAGQSEILDFDFKSRDRKDSQSDYSITVYFNEGCSVSF